MEDNGHAFYFFVGGGWGGGGGGGGGGAINKLHFGLDENGE